MRHSHPTARPVAQRLSQLLLGASLLLAGSLALAADLFVVTAPNRFAEVSPGVYPLRVNAEVLAGMAVGDSVRVNLPGQADSTVVLDRLVRHGSGNLTWIGHLQGRSDDYRVLITLGANGAIGQMLLPDASYRIEPNQVVAPAAAGEQAVVPDHNDGLALPPAKRPPRSEAVAGDNAFAAGALTRIDVLVLYTAGLPARYSGGADALIDHLVAITNQAYLDSGIAIEVHLVGKIKTNYLEDNDNDPALTDLTNAGDIALTQVPAWRAQYGADLVTLVRPFDKSAMNSCGVGWVNGGGGVDFDPAYGYSVVSYGKSIDGQKYLCSDYTFAHELGHNMGAAHDRKTQNEYSPTNYSGAYPYSYGYGYAGAFGTIMSYIDPRKGKFSNPAITCEGYPCGIATSDPKYAANNTLTLNNSRSYVAAFMPTMVDPPLTGIALSAVSLGVGATATITPTPSSAALGSCSSDNGTVATVAGNSVSALAAGTATISCSGFSASLTVLPPLPVQAFAVSADQQASGNGNVKLQLTLLPDAADINKTADLYLVAQAVVGGADYWFVQYANGSWAPLGATLLPFATRTLASSDASITALNGEFSAADLKGLAVDLYLGYTLSGAPLSTLKYRKVYSFR